MAIPDPQTPKDDAVEIFISYACDDNVVSPGLKNGKGFVSALIDHLDYVFKRQGPPKVRLWWDERQIDRATRIDNAIDEGIKRASLLLVVMSRNWLSRPWCLEELKLFSQQQDHSQRIILLHANYVERASHPPALQNMRGFDFFSLDNWRQAGNERLFFDLGEVKDPLFYDNVNELGGLLWSRSRTIGNKAAPSPLPTPDAQGQGQGQVPAQGQVLGQVEGQVREQTGKNGRIVYLAKPAADTATFYRRVASELEREGYTVVPPVTQGIPEDSGAAALEFIDGALKLAECAIHLLGEKKGSKPDEELDYIVPLQLQRAALRAGSADKSAEQAAPGVPFQRIIWAPKSPEEDCKFTVNGFREPVEVVKKFDTQHEGDQLYGDVSSAFLTNIKRDLERRKAVPEAANVAEADGTSSRVYIWHRQDDWDFARQVRRWLQENKVETMLPGRDNDPDKDKLHRMNLAECDAVFLCWAHATDVWAKMSARELRNWRDLGRKEKFVLRSLVLGPPPDESKTEDDLPSIPHEIDTFIDLSNDPQLALDRLKPLLERSRPRHV